MQAISWVSKYQIKWNKSRLMQYILNIILTSVSEECGEVLEGYCMCFLAAGWV